MTAIYHVAMIDDNGEWRIELMDGFVGTANDRPISALLSDWITGLTNIPTRLSTSCARPEHQHQHQHQQTGD